MSVLKYANGQNRGSDAIRKSVTYILDPGKSSQALTEVNGVSSDTPYEDMETIQTLLGKTTGRRYIHFILSFDKNVSVMTAYDVACYAAEYYADSYQYILAIHTNTTNVHAHIILNAVNIRTGKKFSQSRKEMLAFREHVNFCLRQFGLNEIGKNSTSDIVVSNLDFIDDFDGDSIDDFADSEEFDPYRSFFGPCDQEEVEAVAMAEDADRLQKLVYHYFEGQSENFSNEILSCDVDSLFWEWLDMKYYEKEEEEAEKHESFFDRYS